MRKSIGPRLVPIAVTAAVIAIIAALLIPAYLAWRFAGDLNSQCERFRLVLRGIQDWDETQGKMPEATYHNSQGTPCYSWRMAVTRYLESWDYDTESPWNVGANKALADGPNFTFCSSLNWSRKVTTDTTIYAVSGPGTAFDGKPHRLADLPGDLVLLIEIADSGTHWMAPGDLDVRKIPNTITEGTSGKGVIVAFADGEVWFLHREVPINHLKQFLTIAGAQNSDREQLLRPYALIER